MLRDESFHPLEFDHHLYFNKDSENPLSSDWITSNAHPIIEPVGFLCNSFSSCLSCLSMFPNAANRINRTWSLLATGHKDPLFHPRMICPVVGGGGPTCLKQPPPDGPKTGVRLMRQTQLPSPDRKRHCAKAVSGRGGSGPKCRYRPDSYLEESFLGSPLMNDHLLGPRLNLG